MPTINEANISPENIENIVSMGFEKEKVIEALRKANDDCGRAVELLIKQADETTSPTNYAADMPPLEDADQHSTSRGTAVETYPGQAESNNVSAVDYDYDKYTAATTNRVTHRDADISVSVPYQNTMYEPAATTTSKFDDDMTKAIEASLRETSIYDTEPVNPRDRLRVDLAVPVGLKNIGNTCYINSLLQTYFFLPRFRKLILEYNTAYTSSESIRELQRLFAYLVESERKYIDPSLLVAALNNEGVKIKIGDQEDVGEFSDQFLSKIEEVIIKTNKMHRVYQESTSNVIKDFFYGQGIDTYECSESDGTRVKIVKQNEFCNLILNVSSEITDLYCSMDAYTSQETVDFTTENAYRTSAVKSTWFKRLPPNLIIQLQRTSYDNKTKSASKIHTPLTFPSTLYIDRYLEQNKDKTISKREKIQSLKKEIQSLNERLEAIKKWKGKNIGLDDILDGAIEYLNEQKGLQHLQESISLLTLLSTQTQQTISNLESEIQRLEHEVKVSFDDMNDYSYTLHAILVHDGNANSGHYWAYLHLHDKWFKFNDMIVTQIEEEEVMSVSMGRSESNACAYCLIYVESINFHLENVSDDLDIQFWKSRISSYLTQEIIDDNDRLQREIIEYEEEQKRKKKEELRNFQYNFMQRVREVENLSNSRHTSTYYFSLSIQSDERIRSYAVFLSALGERGAALITIAEEVHQKMFHRKLFDLAQSEDDQDTQRLLEMLNAIGLNILDLPDNEYMAQMELQFNTFILVARLFAAGLYYLRQAEFDDALMSFRLAIYYDSSLDQRVSRQKDIRTYLTINLQRLFQRALDVLLTQYDAAIYQIRRVVALLPSVWETSPQINEYVDKKIIENFALHVNYRSKMYHQVCTKSQIEEIIDIHQEMSATPDYQLRHNRAKLSQTDRQLLLEEIRKRKQQTIEIEDMESVPLKYYLLDIPTHPQQLAHWLKQMIHNVEMEYHQDANKLEFYDQFRTANYYEDADTTPSYRRMYGDSVSYGSKLDDSDYDDYDNVPNQNNVSNDWNNSPVDYEQNPYPSDEDDPSDYRHTFSDNEDISPVGQVSPTQFKRHQQVGTFKDPTEKDDVE